MRLPANALLVAVLLCAACDCGGSRVRDTPAPRCGDGHLDPGELCDDGGTAAGDGCDAACQDENECLDGQARCDALASCTNAVGSYACACPDGYTTTDAGRTCVDIDECLVGPGCGDPERTVCTNEQGRFRCDCREGFFAKDGACEPWSDCPDGTFVAAEPTALSDRRCEPCPSGTLPGAVNAARCEPVPECPAGSKWSMTSLKCVSCGDGVTTCHCYDAPPVLVAGDLTVVGAAPLADGTGLLARFRDPYRLRTRPTDGAALLLDEGDALREVTGSGVVTTLVTGGSMCPGGGSVVAGGWGAGGLGVTSGGTAYWLCQRPWVLRSWSAERVLSGVDVPGFGNRRAGAMNVGRDDGVYVTWAEERPAGSKDWYGGISRIETSGTVVDVWSSAAPMSQRLDFASDLVVSTDQVATVVVNGSSPFVVNLATGTERTAPGPLQSRLSFSFESTATLDPAGNLYTDGLVVSPSGLLVDTFTRHAGNGAPPGNRGYDVVGPNADLYMVEATYVSTGPKTGWTAQVMLYPSSCR